MNEIQQRLVEEELEHFRDGWIDRREFLRRAGLFGMAAAAASAVARTVTPGTARAATLAATSPFHVEEDDPSITPEWVWYDTTDGTQMKAYVAWPSGEMAPNSLPCVAVCQENQGLNAHIKDVARRFAKQGYVAIAPDLLSHVGPPTDELAPDAIRPAQSRLSARQNPLDFVAALDFMKLRPAVDSTKLAAIGFCFGGGVIWELTTLYPDLVAAAPFYGTPPPTVGIPQIRAAVLGVYAELDTGTTARGLATQPTLDAAGITYTMKVYPGSQHAFHNDTGASYNPVTAPEAWMDTLNWFAEHLGMPAPTFAPLA
ncbi:MAG: dienelactone hydrolase family protein [Chloroflexi bacterium]|nr:dienelactone hydrolase family protein [Chloroflexota bacterium]